MNANQLFLTLHEPVFTWHVKSQMCNVVLDKYIHLHLLLFLSSHSDIETYKNAWFPINDVISRLALEGGPSGLWPIQHFHNTEQSS